jgi:hypothetical protein
MLSLCTANEPDHAVFKLAAKTKYLLRKQTGANNDEDTQTNQSAANYQQGKHQLFTSLRRINL